MSSALITPEMEEYDDYTPSMMASQLESSGSEFEVAPKRKKKKKKKAKKKKAKSKGAKRCIKAKAVLRKENKPKKNTKVAEKEIEKRTTKILKVYADKGPSADPTVVIPMQTNDVESPCKLETRETRRSSRNKVTPPIKEPIKRPDKAIVRDSPSILEVEEFLDPPSRGKAVGLETHKQVAKPPSKPSAAKDSSKVVKVAKPAQKPTAVVKDRRKAAKPAGKPVAKDRSKVSKKPTAVVKDRPKFGKKRSQQDPGRGAKKKSKTQFLSKSDAKRRLKEYMLTENRPYTHTVLFDNLRQQVKKSMLPPLLKELAAENVLTVKAWKKTLVYWANQDNMPTITNSEMAEMDARIKELEAEKIVLDEKHGRAGSEVRKLEKEPTDAALKAEIKELTSKANATRAKVDTLTKGSAKLVDAKTYEKMGKEFLKYFKHYRKRRAGCRKLAEGITEHLKQKPKAWLKKNCDVDEDYGIEYKSYKELVSEWKEKLSK